MGRRWGRSVPGLSISCLCRSGSSISGCKRRGSQKTPGEAQMLTSPTPLPFCGSDLEGSSEWCRRFLRLRLIYFIAGVPELLCWLQHIIWNFPPEQSFIFGNPPERDFGMVCEVAGAQLVQAQDTPSTPGSCSAQGSKLPASPVFFTLPFPLLLKGGGELGHAFVCVCVHRALSDFISPQRVYHLLPKGREKVTDF